MLFLSLPWGWHHEISNCRTTNLFVRNTQKQTDERYGDIRRPISDKKHKKKKTQSNQITPNKSFTHRIIIIFIASARRMAHVSFRFVFHLLTIGMIHPAIVALYSIQFIACSTYDHSLTHTNTII